MKTSTVNGVTYELPEGWEPIESAPTDIAVNTLNVSGAYEWDTAPFEPTAIAWQHIVAPKVMPWKPKDGEKYWILTSGRVETKMELWSEDGDAYDLHSYSNGNCYPTQAAAESARERVIAAHNGGAKWKGGV